MLSNHYKFYVLTIFIPGMLLLHFFSNTSHAQNPLRDQYEYDDVIERAGLIHVDDKVHQVHNFHSPDDHDWVKFCAVADEIYTVKAVNLGINCDVLLELYDMDKTGPLISMNRKYDGIGVVETLEWEECFISGVYYLKITHAKPEIFGEDTSYELSIIRPDGPDFPGNIRGVITDAFSKAPIQDVSIFTENQMTQSVLNGVYKLLSHEQGNYNLTAVADGYKSSNTDITIVKSDNDYGILDIELTKNCIKGDVDGNGELDLEDIKLARKFFYGEMQPTTSEFCGASFCRNQEAGVSLCDLKRIFEEIVYSRK